MTTRRSVLLSLLIATCISVNSCDKNAASGGAVTGQDTPTDVILKWHRSLRDGDKKAFQECYFGNPEEYVEVTGDIFDMKQAAFRFQDKLRAAFGPDAWERYCKLGSHMIIEPRDRSQWPTKPMLQMQGKTVCLWYRDGLGQGKELGDELRLANGAWYFVVDQKNTAGDIREWMKSIAEEYERKTEAPGKPGVTLEDVYEL